MAKKIRRDGTLDAAIIYRAVNLACKHIVSKTDRHRLISRWFPFAFYF